VTYGVASFFAEQPFNLLSTVSWKCLIWLEGLYERKKLRADPDDQPPIEERSIMMPNGSQSIRSIIGTRY
jgi:hypothetical protein